MSLTKSSVVTTSIVSDKMDDIKKIGYLKKLKTMKKKFFILRGESESGPSRLEYYDSEKKWKIGHQPKRSICLKTCFNINRKLDTKQKCVIALYTKDDSFAISLDNDAELEEWLVALLQLQHGEEYFGTNEKPKPNFEHVWQVNVKSKGLGSSKNIIGSYRLCLTERSLSLVQMSSNDPEVYEFPLVSIRRCGNSESFFFMEVGRNTVTGAGELWMLTEDTLIAQNMHETILNAMKSSHKDDVAPRPRTRASSANEASKPISVRRHQTNPITAYVSSRDRADSMPTRPRTISDGQKDGGGGSSADAKNSHIGHGLHRPMSMYCHSSSVSPPMAFSNSAISSAGSSSLSVDEFDSSQPDNLLQKYTHCMESDSAETHTLKEDSSQEGYMTMAPGEAKSNAECQEESGGYMEMNPLSAIADLSLSPPTQSESLTANVVPHNQPYASPPLWLGVGSRAGFTSNKSMSTPTVSSAHASLTPGSQQPVASGNDYLEMTASVGSSSSGALDGYMPMSPLSSSGGLPYGAYARTPPGKYHPLTASRPSSDKSDKQKTSLSEGVNGYVPMAPIKDEANFISKAHSPLADEGCYMDMNPTVKSADTAEHRAESSSRRSSVSSGTPSTDLCFPEYQLEKVRAYFTSTDEDEPIVRAYSIGSRNDYNRRQELDSSADSSRTRAFSVGSKVGVRFSNKHSAGNSSNNESAGPGNSGISIGNKVGEDKGKKSSSAPVLGTSPFGNSWLGSASLMNRMHSTSRSSNTNDDLMEMDFPESGNNRPTSCTNASGVQQSTWMDGSRRSGAASSSSSTDSLRRTPTGSRPHANSRSSHTRPNKLETLQSIGEKSSSSKVSSTTDRGPCLKSPFVGVAAAGEDASTLEVGTLAAKLSPKSPEGGAILSVQRPVEVVQGLKLSPKLGSKPNYQSTSCQDYANMTVGYRSGSSDDADTSEKGTTYRKCSLPVQIRGTRQCSKLPDSASDSGEYVSIDMSRGYSTSPGKFMITTSTTIGTASPLTVTSRASSCGSGDNLSYRFPTVSSPVVSSPSSILETNSSLEVNGPASNDQATSTSATKILTPKQQDESKPVLPEYVNLQFGQQRASQLYRPNTGGSRSSQQLAHNGSPLQNLPGTNVQCCEGDYAVMDPLTNAKSSYLNHSSRDTISVTHSCDDPSIDSAANAITDKLNICSASDSDCRSEQNVGAEKSGDCDAEIVEDCSSGRDIPSSSSVVTQEGQQENTVSSSNVGENPVRRESGDDDHGHELNYASLDLTIAGAAADDSGDRQPRLLRDSKSASSLSSGSLSSLDELLTPLSYAKIDFAKSEGLRCTAAPTAAPLGNRL